MNFVNIQASHVVPSKGYKQPSVRTGYEYVLPYKTADNFCKMAEEDGKVLSKTKDLMTVQYKDGREETYNIGTVYTNYEGIDYKNVLVTNLKEGAKFKAGDNLYYHEDFFEQDWLDKSRIVSKVTNNYTIALTTNSETYEDSTAVSSRVMKEITTSVLKERSFILDFDTNIDRIVKVGDEVYPNDILFVDTGDGYNAGNLNETSLSLLEAISSMSPRAKYRGVIDRIEVKYNGDVSDMSPTLASIVNKLDRETYARTKGTRYEARNNKVTGEYSVGGKKLDIDMLELKFYINVELEMAIGDKLAMANQAKSVIGEVFHYDIEGVESKDIVDGMIATVSFIYRVIDSPFKLGTTNRIVRHVSKQASDVYFGDKK